MTWFGLGGPARYVFHPDDAEDLSAFARRAVEAEVPWRVLGCGANVLIRDDGFDGVVVRLDKPAFRSAKWDGLQVELGAGVEMMPFSKRCCSRGMSGLEWMAGIPASVGGAIRMNAGGRDGEFGDVVRNATVLDRNGDIERWDRDRFGFDYRRSNLGGHVVLAASLELKPEDPARVRESFDRHWEAKRSSQPLADRSAGCIFKNPAGKSAGALIDQAGLKGVACGAASVSQRHANFIVARAGATATDVLRLIDLIRDRVRNLFHTELETEIEIW